jgi:phosphotransferase system enzyme I (PtsP)
MPEGDITFRTLDIGGDKVLGTPMHEDNPFMGLRALRFSLNNPEIFEIQLRAMLRAGSKENTRILLPMVESPDQFREARDFLNQVLKELKEESVDCCLNPMLGAMIELPSAVLLIDDIVREADFISVGTNDLVQYMLGVDRTNENVAEHYKSHHPSVLKSLQVIVRSAKRKHIEVSVCGEAATDPAILQFLIGIGVEKVSMDPAYIPQSERFIQSIHAKTAKSYARKLLKARSLKEVERIIDSSIDKNLLPQSPQQVKQKMQAGDEKPQKKQGAKKEKSIQVS